MLNLLLSLALGTAPQAIPPASNTECPVLGEKVTEKNLTVTIKGHNYRICCAPCEDRLRSEPKRYLDDDGSIKRAWEPSGYGQKIEPFRHH